MRPLIVARSFQFSTCFLIALAAMPLVPLIQKEKIGLGTFFLVLGMLTQYFDFYSVPALTLCLPLLYLLALRSASGERGNFGTLARAGASWLSGYVLFWLEKLLLSSLFSPIDGVENGIGEFIYWMQRKPDAGENRLAAAFKNVWSTVCPDVWAALVLLSLAAGAVCPVEDPPGKARAETALERAAPVRPADPPPVDGRRRHAHRPARLLSVPLPGRGFLGPLPAGDLRGGGAAPALALPRRQMSRHGREGARL